MGSLWRVRLGIFVWLACISAAVSARAQAEAANGKHGRVEGSVVGPLGQPMVGVEVWAASWPDLDEVVARTHTDGNGMFVLGRLPMGLHSLFATSDGHTVAWTSARLSEQRPARAVRMRLWPANTIRGRVLDPAGKPVAGALVLGSKDFTWLDGRFRSPEDVTDEQGRFELVGVPIGDQVVRTWAEGYGMREVWANMVEDHELEVRMVRGMGVRVAVRTEGVAADKAANVQVRIYPTRNGSGFAIPRRIEYEGRLAADGTWSLDGVPDCEWNVRLQSDDYTFDPHMVRSERAGKVRDLLFRATSNGSVQLHGVLRSKGGQPLANERLVCRTQRSSSMNGGVPGYATTDAQGRFRMQAPLVPGERFSLHLAGPGWILEQQKQKGHTGDHDERYLVRYEDAADPDRELSLTAVRPTIVRARLTRQDGRPAPFRSCTLQVQRGGHWSAMAYASSGRDGAVRFPGVHRLDVDHRVKVSMPAGAAFSKAFRTGDGGGQDVPVTIPLSGAIRGRLLDASGAPIVGARLMMQNYDLDSGRQIDGSWTRVLTDRKGRYAFVGVSPTGHKITYSDARDDDVFRTEIVAVRAGETVEHDIRLPK